MNILRRIFRRFGYIPAHKRAYAAAAMSRLTADWLQTGSSIDQDIRSGGSAVRTRARDLSQNSEFAKAYLRAIKKNVIGAEGFALQVKAMDGVGKGKKLDEVANSIIEDAFWEWSKPETATVDGKMSFRKVQELVIETAARDGEAFVRLVRGGNVNRFGFALQLIEPEWIDDQYNEDLPNGNSVRLGVEVDGWHRPIAYYVDEGNRASLFRNNAGRPYTRIPAEEMIHLFDPERSDQTRGVSWMAPAMIGLHNLRGYTEAAIVAARVGASKMGFFRDPTGSGEEYTGDTSDGNGNRITTVEPGVFEDIGRSEFVPFDPKYPDQQFGEFVKANLLGVSSALGISYQTLTNDLLGTSYASGRVGLLEERETYKAMQAWMIEMFLNRAFAEWLSLSLLTGAVPLPSAKFDKFNQPRWTGRRWSWVDPKSDVEAAQAAVRSGFKSATQIINEAGGDIEELYQEIAQEKALAEKYGLKFDLGGKVDGQENPADEGNADDNPRPGNGGGGEEDD